MLVFPYCAMGCDQGHGLVVQLTAWTADKKSFACLRRYRHYCRHRKTKKYTSRIRARLTLNHQRTTKTPTIFRDMSVCPIRTASCWDASSQTKNITKHRLASCIFYKQNTVGALMHYAFSQKSCLPKNSSTASAGTIPGMVAWIMRPWGLHISGSDKVDCLNHTSAS